MQIVEHKMVHEFISCYWFWNLFISDNLTNFYIWLNSVLKKRSAFFLDCSWKNPDVDSLISGNDKNLVYLMRLFQYLGSFRSPVICETYCIIKRWCLGSYIITRVWEGQVGFLWKPCQLLDWRLIIFQVCRVFFLSSWYGNRWFCNEGSNEWTACNSIIPGHGLHGFDGRLEELRPFNLQSVQGCWWVLKAFRLDKQNFLNYIWSILLVYLHGCAMFLQAAAC